MLIKIWDWLFTRKTWTIIKEVNVFEKEGASLPSYRYYILQDQFGNIKKKKIGY